jgi:hypothetical protein
VTERKLEDLGEWWHSEDEEKPPRLLALKFTNESPPIKVEGQS